MSIFLGTGASEGIPAAFCSCSNCERARHRGGKNIRSRSSFLIDEKSIIDFGPDFYWQVTVNGLNMQQLQHIFITHTHEDHLSVPELGTRNSGVPAPLRAHHGHADCPLLQGHCRIMAVTGRE